MRVGQVNERFLRNAVEDRNVTERPGRFRRQSSPFHVEHPGIFLQRAERHPYEEADTHNYLPFSIYANPHGILEKHIATLVSG